MRFFMGALLALLCVSDAAGGTGWSARLSDAEAAAAAGRLEEARAALADGVALADATAASQRELLTRLSRVAHAHAQAGDLTASRSVYELALDRARTSMGPNQPATLDLTANLAGVQRRLGNLERAEALARAAYARARERPISDVSIMGRAMNTLGNVASDRGDVGAAIGHYRRALELGLDIWGPRHPNVASTRLNLANALLEAERFDGALPLLEAALAVIRERRGPEDPELADVNDDLGFAYAAVGELAKAQRHYADALRVKRANGFAPGELVSTLNALGKVCRQQGQRELARQHFAEALALAETEHGASHPEVAETSYNLGVVAYEQQRDAEAAAHFRRTLTIWEATGNASDPRAAQIRTIVAQFPPAPAVAGAGR